MLVFKAAALRRGERVLFSQASLTIHAGQKVGITGANGTGKSSLFALLKGELHTDVGEVEVPRQLVIAEVAQETPAVDCSAIDYVLDGDEELRSIEKSLKQAEESGDGIKQGQLYARLETIDGYSARSRAARLLQGLGFTTEQESKTVAAFSGGWRMRLNLAKALMCRSDLLLLDEPTNHLDLDAVIWLEEWLLSYPGTLLLISHDRDFLDRVVGQIISLEHQQLTLYTGNYSAFEKRRAEQLAQQQAGFEKQQREIKHIQSYVDRFKAQATKARQAQSRIKALERMEIISAAHIDSPFKFTFKAPDKVPHPLLTLDKVTGGYGDTKILNQIDFSLVAGDRIGLLGPNGAGKSTLIKLLAGVLTPLDGDVTFASTLRVGYFAQHQVEQLRLDETPLQHLMTLDRQATEQQLRNYLGGFNFKGDRIDEVIAPFSGGEKTRLALALLVYQRPNLLLLDEPTNHLDLEMRHALTVALQDFKGAMILVSHDRNLLNTVTDRLLLVVDGKVSDFNGDIENYGKWLTQHRSQVSSDDETKRPNASDATDLDSASSSQDRKAKRKEEALKRQQLQPLTKALKKAEQLIETLSQEKHTLDHQMADTTLYQSMDELALKGLFQSHSDTLEKLSSAEDEWMMISEQLELAKSD